MHAQIAVPEEIVHFNETVPHVELRGHAQRVRELDAHEPLFLEGDEAICAYEVHQGAVCCFRVLADGRRQVISFAYPGDFIGLDHGNSYRFSCEATCPAQVRLIRKDDLFREANANPGVARRILESTGDNMVQMLDHFLLLGRKSALEKVASFLSAFTRRNVDENANSATVSLPMTRADIADYLGITNETVSRCLTKLKIRGVIDLPAPQVVVVHDIGELEELGEQDF